MARGRMSEEAREGFAEDDKYFGRDKDAVRLYLRSISGLALSKNETGDLLLRKAELQEKLYKAEMSSGVSYERACLALGQDILSYRFRPTLTGAEIRSSLNHIEKSREKWGKGSLDELRVLSLLGMEYEDAVQRSKGEHGFIELEYDAKWLNQFVNEYGPVKREIKDLVNKAVQGNLQLVVPCARKYSKFGFELTDLIQEGNLGLMKGMERYDPWTGYAHSTHCGWWIRKFMLEFIANHKRNVRVPTSVQKRLRKIEKFSSEYARKRGSSPTAKEIASGLELNEQLVVEALAVSGGEVSLNEPIFEEGRTEYLSQLEDKPPEMPLHQYLAIREGLSEEIERLRSESIPKDIRLSEKEHFILIHRFGFNGEGRLTYDEIRERLFQEGITDWVMARSHMFYTERKALGKLEENPRINELFMMLKEAL